MGSSGVSSWVVGGQSRGPKEEVLVDNDHLSSIRGCFILPFLVGIMKTSTITHTIHGAGIFTYIYHLPYKSTKKCGGNLPVPWIRHGLWKSGGPESQWS